MRFEFGIRFESEDVNVWFSFLELIKKFGVKSLFPKVNCLEISTENGWEIRLKLVDWSALSGGVFDLTIFMPDIEFKEFESIVSMIIKWIEGIEKKGDSNE